MVPLAALAQTARGGGWEAIMSGITGGFIVIGSLYLLIRDRPRK